MWRLWVFLGVLPFLLLGSGVYFVLFAPTSQTPSSKAESTLEIGVKQLEKRIDDALDAPMPSADNPQRRNDEPPETTVAPRPSAEELQKLSDEQLEALFAQGPSAEELQKLSDEQLEALFAQGPSAEDMQKLSNEQLAALVALKHFAEEALLERKRARKKP
jgi:hypothetical protein